MVAAGFSLRHVTYGLLSVPRSLKAAATSIIELIALKNQDNAFA